MFGVTNIVKKSDKAKWAYSGYGIAYDGTGTCSLGNNFGEGPNYDVNGSFGSPEKKFSINFSKTSIKFLLTLHYNGDNSSLFVYGK